MSVRLSTDIFIKTCKYDEAYHQYCLASIDKYCTGFGRTVVKDGEHPKGYLHQQAVKLYADNTSNASMLLVTDSDTLFTRPVTPETLLVDGKPIWLHTPAEEMHGQPGPEAWFKVMREFFGVEPEFEFMRRQPFMFPTKLLPELRNFCVRQHGISLHKYIMGSKAFSEWNILGMFAWLFHRDEFHWIDTSKEPLPEPIVRQFWSHDPLEKNLAEIQQILA